MTPLKGKSLETSHGSCKRGVCAVYFFNGYFCTSSMRLSSPNFIFKFSCSHRLPAETIHQPCRGGVQLKDIRVCLNCVHPDTGSLYTSHFCNLPFTVRSISLQQRTIWFNCNCLAAFLFVDQAKYQSNHTNV